VGLGCRGPAEGELKANAAAGPVRPAETCVFRRKIRPNA
jgi:hypothetical protein